ncbi:MAG: hypothetical protein R2827_08075 [Bdellovibrionales bacterium]
MLKRVGGLVVRIGVATYHPIKIAVIFIYFHFLFNPVCQFFGIINRIRGQIIKFEIFVFHKVKLGFSFLYFQLIYHPTSEVIGFSRKLFGLVKRLSILFYHRIYRRLVGVVEFVLIKAYWVLLFTPYIKLHVLTYRAYIRLYYTAKHLHYLIFVWSFHKIVKPIYWGLRRVFIYTPAKVLLIIYNVVTGSQLTPEDVKRKFGFVRPEKQF